MTHDEPQERSCLPCGNSAKSPNTVLIATLVVFLTGCGGDGNNSTDLRKTAVSEQQLAARNPSMTETLRHQYVISRGKTPQEWKQAKEKWITHLRQEYQGVTTKGKREEVAKNSSRFGELMREWNPIHCSVDDLKSVAGEPSKQTETLIEYSFDQGNFATAWRFKISVGRILGVEYVPGE